jgi:hypothetical protein
MPKTGNSRLSPWGLGGAKPLQVRHKERVDLLAHVRRLLVSAFVAQQLPPGHDQSVDLGRGEMFEERRNGCAT